MTLLNKFAEFVGKLIYDVPQFLELKSKKEATSKAYLQWLAPNGTRAQISKEIFAELERQLFLDLKTYLSDAHEIKFDWSEAHSPEGLEHTRTINFGLDRVVATIARTDDVTLKRANDKILAVGSFDFVYPGDQPEDPFFAFWTELFAEDGGSLIPGSFKERIGKIPDHVWMKIPESMRARLISDFDTHWKTDPKVLDAVNKF